MLILFLIGDQYWQKAALGFKKGWNCQNRSSWGSLDPVKKSSPSKISNSPSLGGIFPTPYYYLKTLLPKMQNFNSSLKVAHFQKMIYHIVGGKGWTCNQGLYLPFSNINSKICTNKKELLKNLWPFFMAGVELPQGLSKFKEEVYFLRLSIQIFYFINLWRMKGWVDLGATKWFWTWDLWIGFSALTARPFLNNHSVSS